ncbi:MAG: aminotransferase class I/II-fold pyridoxal phosphate-dependent enzyme [Ruminococcaceae bacterium]|nr:aminotransferase class I/II-fold pyridoxal phosphate-dependent enzyme [Oscillospiraceae bacterium]
MMLYSEFSPEQLLIEKEQLQKRYDEFKAQNLSLDMSRGKPSPQQLDLSMEVLSEVDLCENFKASNGFDCRNYGVLDGIPECKKLFAELLEVEEKNIIIGGNSSLTLMFDYIAQCMTHGAGKEAWLKQGNIKFICPVPGYDRHFGILEHFGIEMINVPMLSDGPDMDKVNELIKDESVKGMILVPKYSNPEGITLSDECVRKIAAMKPAAEDFRVIWDNAYCIHDVNETSDELLNIFEAAKEFSNEDLFIEVTSTSKISFPGAGVSALAASDKNIAMIKKRMTVQTIGNDKLNQLRHAIYFKNLDGLKNHMKKHAASLKPKFDAVIECFTKEFSGTGIAQWKNPNGGYFVSLNVLEGTAKRTGELCKNAGVVLTPPGATYPYGKDPEDKNIRIAPSFPTVEELKKAAELLCISARLAACEKLLKR